MEDPLFEAEIAARLGDRSAAETAYEGVISVGEPAAAVARAQAGLGFLAFEAGEHERAIELLERALADTVAGAETAVAADRLGRAYALTGRYEEGLGLFNRYLAAAKERHDPIDTVRFTALLANTHIDRSDPQLAAEQLLSGILDQARGSLEPAARAGVYWAQSRLHASQNEYELAVRYARQALATLEETEHSGCVANALLLVASLEIDQGNHAHAQALLEQAAPVLDAAGNRYDLGRLTPRGSSSAVALGRREEAARLALGSIPLLGSASPTNMARGYALAASVFRELGDTSKRSNCTSWRPSRSLPRTGTQPTPIPRSLNSPKTTATRTPRCATSSSH